MTRRARARGDLRARLRHDLGFIGAVPIAGSLELRALLEPGQSGPARTFSLDRALLSRARRSARTIFRETPAALEAEVGSAKRWLEQIETLLRALAPSVHERRLLPDPRRLVAEIAGVRASRMLAAAPKSRLVDAVCWLHLGSPDGLETALSWLLPRLHRFEAAEAGADEPLYLALKLVRLAVVDGHRHADLLLDLLTDATLAATPLSPPGDQAPVVTITEEVARIAEAIYALDDKPRRAAISVLDKIAPRALAGRWATWWHETRATLAGVPSDEGALRLLTERTPVVLDVGRWRARFVEWLEASDGELSCLGEALELVPEEVEGAPARLGMFFLWSVCWANAPKHATTLMKRFARYRRAVAEAEAREVLAPWWSYLQSATLPSGLLYGRTVDHWLVEERDAPRRIDALFSALDRSLSRKSRSLERWSEPGVVAMLAELTERLDGAAAEAFTQGAIDASVLRPSGGWIRSGCLRVALDLVGARGHAPANEEIAGFGELLARLVEADVEELEQTDGDPLGIARACEDRAVAQVLSRLVMRGEVSAVASLGARLRALGALGVAPPSLAIAPARRRAWQRHYPPELRPTLAALAGSDPKAEATAAHILGRAFPTPARLGAEIAAIEARLARAPDAKLARRLANLKQRLATKAPAAATVEKLVAKLSTAVDRSQLAAWLAEAEAVLGEALARELGVTPVPWLLQAPLAALWPHLFALSGRFRRLAIRLLRARLGPHPWDLRDDPRHRSHREDLERRGIATRPWLDGIGVVRYPSRRGDVYLQLERDPVEVLLMGKHFGTCLSPGGFNFFSAVANAVDLNKRVVYGRDEAGAVIGRSLLALTDEGSLLAFHPYSHHEDWAFSQHLGDFCRRLAGAMKTTIASHGEVPRLLAPEWYDDGPVDITGRFAALGSGSPLDEALATIEPSRLGELLARELAPDGLDAVTAPMVLRLEPIQARPELAAAMLAIVEAISGLDLATRELALERAWLAGARDEARRFAARNLLGDRSRARLRRPITLVVLTEIGRPSLALRCLASSRARGVRRWADEPDPWRIFAAARAHEALHRRGLATSLYDLALRRSEGTLLRRACSERLGRQPTASG